MYISKANVPTPLIAQLNVPTPLIAQLQGTCNPRLERSHTGRIVAQIAPAARRNYMPVLAYAYLYKRSTLCVRINPYYLMYICIRDQP